MRTTLILDVVYVLIDMKYAARRSLQALAFQFMFAKNYWILSKPLYKTNKIWICVIICSHLFDKLIDSQPFRSRANSLSGAKRPTAPWPICSMELSLPGAKWPGNLLLRKYIATYARRESSMERNGQGAKGPRSERTRERIGPGPIGRFAPGSEWARGREGSVPTYTYIHNVQN